MRKCAGRRVTLLQIPVLLLLGVPSLASEEVPRSDASLVAAASLQGDAHRGRKIYEHNCIGCHEGHGFGDPFQAVPALAGQRFDYLVQQIASFAAGERSSTPMHWALAREHMREPQTWVDVAQFLSALPVMAVAHDGSRNDRNLGARLFHAQCAACHGDDAGGRVGSAVPSLRNQHYSYLVQRLHLLRENGPHRANQALRFFLRGFDEREMAAVANYLAYSSASNSQNALPR